MLTGLRPQGPLQHLFASGNALQQAPHEYVRSLQMMLKDVHELVSTKIASDYEKRLRDHLQEGRKEAELKVGDKGLCQDPSKGTHGPTRQFCPSG